MIYFEELYQYCHVYNLLNHLFLTERYILALSLILLWWVPFGIEKVYQQVIAMPRAIKKTSIITLVSLFFIATFLAGFIHIGTSKRHIDKAIVWLKPRIAEEDRVLTNNHLVLYQLKGSISTWKEDFVNFDKTSGCQFDNYRYIVITVHHYDRLSQCNNLTLLQSFHNNKDDFVDIYEVKQK